MKMPSYAKFNEKDAVSDLLTALGYGTKKEETDIIAHLLKTFSLNRQNKEVLVNSILKSPRFEKFFLEAIKQLKPFSLMLVEIYDFLNSYRSTTTRRASKFLIQSGEAFKLDFDLENFPKELLKRINEVDKFCSIIELKFNGIHLNAKEIWSDAPANAEWREISPNWDRDFYDNGFHRALSYYQTVLDKTNSQIIERVNEIASPIMDRLAAIYDFVNKINPSFGAVGETIDVDKSIKSSNAIVLRHFPSVGHTIRNPDMAMYLEHEIENIWYKNQLRTIGEELSHLFKSILISVNFWKGFDISRENDFWFEKNFGSNISEVSPEEFLSKLKSFADDYLQKLNKVAPVVSNYSYKETFEDIVEFLALPFWKNRWFLYELWTLIRTLSIAQSISQIELKNIKRDANDVIEWVLPGGMAKEPVASMGNDQICFWTQRKTFHPGTGAGLEPDLRIMKNTPSYHDIVIIENKDRLAAQKSDLKKILERYVGGTCAESIWLINYEVFPESTEDLAENWPDRNIHIVSNFKPDDLPVNFETEIKNCLRKNLAGTEDLLKIESPASSSFLPDDMQSNIEVTLTWGTSVQDLDLHAWSRNADGTHKHISYQQKGDWHVAPYLELSDDNTSGSGKEILHIGSINSESIFIAIHNFSKEAPISQSGASVNINLGSQNITLKVPAVGQGSWWQVAILNRTTNEIELLQELSDVLPEYLESAV